MREKRRRRPDDVRVVASARCSLRAKKKTLHLKATVARTRSRDTSSADGGGGDDNRERAIWPMRLCARARSPFQRRLVYKRARDSSRARLSTVASRRQLARALTSQLGGGGRSPDLTLGDRRRCNTRVHAGHSRRCRRLLVTRTWPPPLASLLDRSI